MREIVVKSVLNKKKKRDEWFLDDYTLNPYEGCSFNCQYCYIRGSKYGANMSETLAAKVNGPAVLDRQLTFRSKKDQYGIIALASGTDPYLKAEEQYQITQSFLRVIAMHRFPVLIITKSDGVLRDLEILTEIDQRAIHAPDLRGKINRGAIISFSLSTLDAELSSTLEPGAPLPQTRLDTMQRCKDAGFMVGVNCIPVLPYISDTEAHLDTMVRAARDHGADYVLIGGLSLFGSGIADSRVLYLKFLERTRPDLVKQYQRLYGSYFYPPKAYLKDLDNRAEWVCQKYNMARRIIR